MIRLASSRALCVAGLWDPTHFPIASLAETMIGSRDPGSRYLKSADSLLPRIRSDAMLVRSSIMAME